LVETINLLIKKGAYMANDFFSPFGAEVTGIFGGDFDAKLHTYIVGTSDDDTMHKGDLIVAGSTSLPYTDGKYYPEVALASASSASILGIIADFAVYPGELETTTRLPNTLRLVRVYDFPYIEFLIQSDGSIYASDSQENVDIKLYTPGDAFGVSGMAIDSTTIQTTAAQLRLLGFAEGSSPNDAYPIMRCLINQHYYKLLIGA
jgi:hypothetical protein